MSEFEPDFDVSSLGEALLRLSIPAGYSLSAADQLDLHVAGAELNVCAALAALGLQAAWHSKLPDNPLGRLVLSRARGWGVDTSGVTLTADGRVGTYYVELASPPLPARATYDRAGSAFSRLQAREVDWDRLLNTRLLHLTGITPALDGDLPGIVREAVARAKERGVLVSLDINFRAKLWSAVEAASCLGEVMRQVDLLICGRNDVRLLFGPDSHDESELLESLRSLTGASQVVITLGSEGAIAFSEGRRLHQQAIQVQMVDRIGAGDAFTAGLIDGALDGDLEQGLATGAALAAIAIGKHGDTVTVSREEVGAVVGLTTDAGTGVER